MGTFDKVYNLTWGEFNSCLGSAVQSLREDSDLVDVTLSAEGRIFSAHKLVLGACSPLLMKLVKSTRCHHPVLMLAGISANDLEAILEFIYQGEVNIEPSQLPSLLQAAHYLDIQALSPAALVNSSKGSSEKLSRHVDEVLNSYVNNENLKQSSMNNNNNNVTMKQTRVNEDDNFNNKETNSSNLKKTSLNQKRVLRSSTTTKAKCRKKTHVEHHRVTTAGGGNNSVATDCCTQGGVVNAVAATQKDDDELCNRENTFNTFFNEFFDDSFECALPLNVDNSVQNKNHVCMQQQENGNVAKDQCNLYADIKLDRTTVSTVNLNNNNNLNNSNGHFQSSNNNNNFKQQTSVIKRKSEKELYLGNKQSENESDFSDNEIMSEREELTYLLTDTNIHNNNNNSKKTFNNSAHKVIEEQQSNNGTDKVVHPPCVHHHYHHSASKLQQRKSRVEKQSSMETGSEDESQIMPDSNCHRNRQCLHRSSNSNDDDKSNNSESHTQLYYGLENNVESENNAVIEDRKISELPISCKYCGTTIRQSRNLRRHIEMMHCKPRLKTKSKKSEILIESQNSSKCITSVCNNKSFTGGHIASPNVITGELNNNNNHDRNNINNNNNDVINDESILTKNGVVNANGGNIMTISSRVLSFPSLSIIPSQNTLSANEISCLSFLPANNHHPCFSAVIPTNNTLMPNNVSFITNNSSNNNNNNNNISHHHQQPVSIVPNTSSISIAASPLSVTNNTRYGEMAVTNSSPSISHRRIVDGNICIPVNTITKLNSLDTRTLSSCLCADNCLDGHVTVLR